MPRSANQLRIIGGRWRGSRIVYPPLAAIRPSPDRVRETLFNWLQQPIVGARCLDLFAGSGALGLEALSRGAAQVTFVDREPQVGLHLRQTLERLGGRDATVVVEDAQRFLLRPAQLFDIVFLDPPFESTVLEQVASRLQQGWLAPALISMWNVQLSVRSTLPAQWAVHRTKHAGQVAYPLRPATQPTRFRHDRRLYPGTLTRSPMAITIGTPRRRHLGRVKVATGESRKAPLFTVDERRSCAWCWRHSNVEVTGYTGLTVDFARQMA
jgi:16S rRNA (guanine966-N2)-methyltransferase